MRDLRDQRMTSCDVLVNAALKKDPNHCRAGGRCLQLVRP